MASEGNEATTYLLYKKVNDEIAQKVEKINNSAISPNRRKILLSVFGYIRSQIEEKMKALSANTNKE
jgi:transposase